MNLAVEAAYATQETTDLLLRKHSAKQSGRSGIRHPQQGNR